MPVDTIPFTLVSNQRATGTNDRRMVNIVSEAVKNPLTQEAYYSVAKRPCLANWTQPLGGSATGRGVYAWHKTGKVYSIFGTRLCTSTLGGTTTLASLASSTGRCWFTETPEGASTQVLIVSDGLDDYFINAAETTVQIDESDDAQFPTPNLGPVWLFSNYLVHATTLGVVNSDLNNYTAYTAGSTLSASALGDALEATLPMRDQLALFGKGSIEFIFDNGNPTGTPFLPIDQNRLSFGLASRNTLAWSGDMAIFVGENQAKGDGGRSVWMMQTGGVKEISDSVLNRFLAAEGSSISSATAWMERCAGHLLYVLNLASADRSFVYNVSQGMWDGEWEDANGGNKFNGAFVTSLDGVVYVQDATNGRIYTLSTTTFQDSGTTISVTLQTEGRDQNTSNRKFGEFAELICDTQSSGEATLSASDDDGATYSTIGAFNLASEVKRIYRVGSWVGKRQWRLTHSVNTAWRAKLLRISYSVGAH